MGVEEELVLVLWERRRSTGSVGVEEAAVLQFRRVLSPHVLNTFSFPFSNVP